MSLRSVYSSIFQPVLQDGTPFQGQINAAIPGNVAIGDSTTSYTLSINNQTITSTSGNLNISGNISATGSLAVSAATISNALNVSGIVTVSALNVRNYVNVSGLASLSNVNICGGVNITGNAFLNSNLEVKRSISSESVYSTTLSGVTLINGAPYVAGGNPFNWSTRPAISDVNIAGYSISGVSNLTVSNNVSISGSTIINSSLSAESVYSTTLSGVTLINGAPYVPGVNPSNWATYPAVTNLSMAGFNIGSVNAVSVSGRLIVDGSATMNGLVQLSNTNVSGLLNVSGGNVQNNWNVSGQLNAENASIVANLGVSGDAVLSNAYITALYGGATTLSSLSVQSNISVSGESILGGRVTVSDVLNVSGLTTLSGLIVQNNVSVSGIVYATNLSAVSFINGISFNAAGIPSNWASYGAVGDVDISGNDIYNVDNLNVSGLSVFAGGVSIPSIATISHANVVGTVSASNLYASDVLNVSGLATISGLIVQNLLSANSVTLTNLSATNLYVSNVATISDLVVLNTTIHIGASAGFTNQGGNGVAIGLNAGRVSQGSSAIAIGTSAATLSQGSTAVAIGNLAGQTSQETEAIAIGVQAGRTNQYRGAVAIGRQAGASNQQSSAIAIGVFAGNISQGANSIAIGRVAGASSQISNSIILNATESILDAQTQSGFYVAPVSQSSNLSGLQLMTYNPATSQIQQNSNITLSGGNVGIGMSNPTHVLDVCGNQAVLGITNSNYGGIRFFSALPNAIDGDYFIGRGGENTNRDQLVIHSTSTSPSAGINFMTTNAISRLYIQSSTGNVGIGISNPTYSLHVTGSNLTFADITCNNPIRSTLAIGNSNVPSCKLHMGSYYTGGVGSAGSIQAAEFFNSVDNPVALVLNPIGGNVGVNCNSPQYTLDVNGTINCTSLRTANPPAGPAGTRVAASGRTTTTTNIGPSFTSVGLGLTYNVQSVFNFDTGKYTVIFTNPLPSSDYIVLITSSEWKVYGAVAAQFTSYFEVLITLDDGSLRNSLFQFVVYN